MIVTVGKIVSGWHEPANSLVLNVIVDPHGTIVTDSIISDSIEMLNNDSIGQYVYICDEADVSNNLILGPGGRLTGRLVLWNDGTIRIAQNNHADIGVRVNIE